MAIFKRKATKPPKDSKSQGEEATKGSFSTVALVPVLPASVLLSHKKRADFINSIAKYTRLPRKLFDELYRSAINNYAEFAQRLPAVKGAKYDVLGGGLELGLERAAKSMEQYQTYLVDNGIYPKQISMQQELWNYVMFSASLLYDCGRLAEHYHVQLFDEAREEAGDWLPAQANMKEQGAYYLLDKRMHTSLDSIPELTVIIAKRLLPEKGFEWITSQRATLETWLQLLAADIDDEDGTRTLFLSLFLWVDNYLISGDVPGGGSPRPTKKYTIPMLDFNKPPVGAEGVKPAAGGQISAEQGPLKSGGREDVISGQYPNLGGEFLEWLRSGIESGVLNYNSLASVIQVVREGLIFRGGPVYGDFLKAKGLSDKFTVADVEKSFQQLGVTEPGLQGQAEVKVQKGNDTKNIENWTLVSNLDTVMPDVKAGADPKYHVYSLSRIIHHYKWYQDLAQKTTPGYVTKR